MSLVEGEVQCVLPLDKQIGNMFFKGFLKDRTVLICPFKGRMHNQMIELTNTNSGQFKVGIIAVTPVNQGGL